MKQIHYLSFLLILSVSISFVSCRDDDDKKGLETAVTDQSWTAGKPLLISVDNILQVDFNAAAQWTAHTYSKWCSLLTDSGEKGPNTLKLLAASEADANRTSTITIKVKGYSPVSFEVTQKACSGTIAELNVQVDQYLKGMYLWTIVRYKIIDRAKRLCPLAQIVL